MSGDRLGPYRIERELGAGGMGRVFAAIAERECPRQAAGTRVALKVIHPHLVAEEDYFRRFQNEAEIGFRVRHPNVVRTLSVDSAEDTHFIAMEYVEGQTLRDLLGELGTVPEDLCRHIGCEVARGLQAIHDAGAVHRDLKPENVLITPGHAIKVMDLGVARLQDAATRLSQTGAFIGSLHYAAPEQFGARAADIDHRADLHSLGLLLYELACGQHPFDDEDFRVVLNRLLHEEPRRVHEIRPQLSPFFEDVVHTLLAKDREKRFPRAADVADILETGESGTWWEQRAIALRIETRQPLRRIRIVRETAIYGRDRELAQLWSLFEAAKSGSGRVLLLDGEAGIGKSRLVDEFVGRLRDAGEDVNFLFGSYPPTGAATASGALSTAFREQLGPEGSARYLASTPSLVPAFDALLLGDIPPDGSEALTRDSLGSCFVSVTRGLAAERTTVLLIDDLHFAPIDALGMFMALALAAPGHRVLLIGTMRPGVAEDWISNLTRLEHATRTTLGRLGPKDLMCLLEESFRSRRLARELAHQVGMKSDGNPFFAFEIVRGLRDAQFITQRDDGTWASTRRIEEIEIPSSVMDLIQARVADLDPDERDLLDLASCCGFDFDPALVADACGQQRIPVLRNLANIERRHRLVRAAGRAFVFDHHQVQEALYGALPEMLREEYHAALATALESREGAGDRRPSELPGDVCVELSEHFLEGARGGRALRYLGAAHEHLVSGYMHGQAVALDEAALAVPRLLSGGPRAETLLRMSRLLETIGRIEQQREVLVEAVDLADESGDIALRGQAHAHFGHRLERDWAHDAAIRELDLAIRLAQQAEDRETAMRASSCRALVLRNSGRIEEARKSFEALIAQHAAAGDRLAEAGATGNLGSIHAAVGRLDDARRCHERHLALCRELGFRRGEATATANLGILLHRMRELDASREVSERALAIVRETGARQLEGRITGTLGLIHWAQRRREEARDCLERAIALAREVGDRGSEARGNGNLAMVLLELGQFDVALERAERHLAIATQAKDARAIAGGHHYVANALFARGRLAEALEHAEASRLRACEQRDRGREMTCHALLGTLHTVTGAFEEARSAHRLAREIASAKGDGTVFVASVRGLGRLAQLEGDLDSAERLYREAENAARESEHETGLAATLLDLGELRQDQGRSEVAAELLVDAVSSARRGVDSDVEVIANCRLAALQRDSVASARRLVEQRGNQLRPLPLAEAHFLLWQLDRDVTDLAAAHTAVRELLDRAPPERRDQMVRCVPLFRDTLQDWGRHGAL
jgi:tetratricopeptide (TPR) repeat protein